MKNVTGPFIQAAREKAGLSQKAITNQLGWKSAQMLSNVENARSLPPVKAIQHLAKILKVKRQDLASVVYQDKVAAYEKKLLKEFVKLL